MVAAEGTGAWRCKVLVTVWMRAILQQKAPEYPGLLPTFLGNEKNL